MIYDFFIRILAGFIPNAEKRRNFRSKNMLKEREKKFENLSQNVIDATARYFYMNKMNLAASRLHPETFGKYKNAFAGRDVVLVAGGGSVKNFKPIKNAIYVGVNRAYKYDKIKLDYLFISDYRGFQDIDDIDKLPYDVEKFYGILPHDMLRDGDRSIFIPESIALRHGAHRFYMKDNADRNIPIEDLTITYDISTFPLMCFSSIVTPAMQFILWGNPRRIYLVGCDCNLEPHFYNNKKSTLYLPGIMDGWQKIRDFAHDYYPETEIISVNPVGLKGMFKDLYQKKDKK